MKIKNGKAHLEKGEVRIGNFFVKEESEHVKVTDLNAVFSFRVRKAIPVGMFIYQSLEAIRKGEDGHTKGMGNYLAVLWALMSTVPDGEFLETAYLACEDCMKRHPEVYGLKAGEPTEEDEKKAEGEIKEMMQFEEEVKNLPEDEGSETRDND